MKEKKLSIRLNNSIQEYFGYSGKRDKKVLVDASSVHEIGTGKNIIFVPDVERTCVLDIIATYKKSLDSGEWRMVSLTKLIRPFLLST